MVDLDQHIDEQSVRSLLKSVKDPEIPLLSIVDLGMLSSVEVNSDSRTLRVHITPTFVGCPAIDTIQTNVRECLSTLDSYTVEVVVDLATPWSSNRLTEEGRQALAAHGLALPPRFEGAFEPEILLNAECPFCHSTNTKLVSPFGPTLCRALYHCNSCLQGFEQFKAI